MKETVLIWLWIIAAAIQVIWIIRVAVNRSRGN